MLFACTRMQDMVDIVSMALRLQTTRRPTPYATNAFPASAFIRRAVPANEYRSNNYSANAFAANTFSSGAVPVNGYTPNNIAANVYPTGFGTRGVVAGRNVAKRRVGTATSSSPAVPTMVWVILAMSAVVITMLIFAANHNKAQDAANLETLRKSLEEHQAARAHNEKIWQQMAEEERGELTQKTRKSN